MSDNNVQTMDLDPNIENYIKNKFETGFPLTLFEQVKLEEILIKNAINQNQNFILEDYKKLTGKDEIDNNGLKEYINILTEKYPNSFLSTTLNEKGNKIEGLFSETSKNVAQDTCSEIIDYFIKNNCSKGTSILTTKLKLTNGIVSKATNTIGWGLLATDYILTYQEGLLAGKSTKEIYHEIGEKMMMDGAAMAAAGGIISFAFGGAGATPGLILMATGAFFCLGGTDIESEENAFDAERAPKEFLKFFENSDIEQTKSLMDLLNDYAKTLPSEAPDVKTTLGIRQDILNQSLDTYNSIAANPGKYGLPDPIAIDLDGDGIETVSKEKSTAYFDLDKNGYAEKTGWISGDDALLVRDINGNSIIDDSSELFGENTALAGGGTAATGYQALSDLDSNNDGKLSSEDDAFNELKIWQDKNQDGISQADELMSLEEAGIKNISLDTVNINSGDGNGNIIEKVSKVEFEDGKVTQAGQFRFATDTLISLI